MKKILLFILFFSCVHAWSQTRAGGVVKNVVGEPVPFVNVIFPNSAEGTITSEDGRFYINSPKDHDSLRFSFVGYQSLTIPLKTGNNTGLEIILQEESQGLSEVWIFQGKTSKKNNPALDILRKIWENRRSNGTRIFDHYQFRKYEKQEFDLNTIDSAVITSKAFRGMEFVFDKIDTSVVTGKSFLPIFINESVHRVYGDNVKGRKKEVLVGNKNSGFNDNKILIDAVKDMYIENEIYDNYLRIFDKNFISPLSTTGIDTYNYILADSTFIGDKWCYNIVYYPRRKNELTFKGNFWVNDTTFAIKKIDLEMSQNANINWVNGVFLSMDYDVVNDSVFLLKRDFFMADFSFERKDDAGGIYGKRTVLYDNYEFNRPMDDDFYNRKVTSFEKPLYNRAEEFWEQNRLEPLSRNESGIYEMLDSLRTLPAFKRIYTVTSIAATGYIDFNGWDIGPVFTFVNYNEVEGLRLRLGARTYFGQHDPWRIEGYTAYGFKDKRFKYGLLGKVMLEPQSRLIFSAGYRDDVEQLGGSLTNTSDVLGRSLASSSIISVGDNSKLSNIKLSMAALEIEPWSNFTVRFAGSHRLMESASPSFSLAWYENKDQNIISNSINQTEISTMLSYYPGRHLTGFGVERLVTNGGRFPSLFFNYSVGVKGLLNSDFDYRKYQFFYDQPWWIGGIGLANIRLEAGTIDGEVPLGLLNVIPANQSFFGVYNTFPLLNFYEFVTDTYVSAHFEHNFNGKLFSYVPGLKKFNLREHIGVRGVWGELSEANKNIDASGIQLLAPSGEPYYEYSAGVGNIFKFIRIDAHWRGNYYDNPDARKFGITATLGFHF